MAGTSDSCKPVRARLRCCGQQVNSSRPTTEQEMGTHPTRDSHHGRRRAVAQQSIMATLNIDSTSEPEHLPRGIDLGLPSARLTSLAGTRPE